MFTVADLQFGINKMKKKRAVATDGWRVPEMCDLPAVLLEWATHLFRCHEAGMEWPPAFETAIVSSPPKESESHDGTVAESLFAPLPEATRPISNCVAFLSAWDIARYSSRST